MASFFSITEFMESIGINNIILGVIFIVGFWLLKLGLKKIFGKNETLSSGLALALSFLITYVFNRIQINFEDAFSFLGLDVLEFIAHPLLWIALLVITIFFLGVRNFFLLLGGLLIFASFFMYEKMFVAFVGIVFVLIGIWRIIRRKIKPSHSLGIIPIPFIPFPSYEETI